MNNIEPRSLMPRGCFLYPMDAAITTAVFAAEQIYGAGNGPEKLDYAIQYLHDHGFDVDSRQIEAQVYDLLNSDKNDNMDTGKKDKPLD